MTAITPLTVHREDIVGSRLAGSATDSESKRRKFRLYMKFSPATISETLDVSNYGAKTVEGLAWTSNADSMHAVGTAVLTVSGTTLTINATGTVNTCVVCGV